MRYLLLAIAVLAVAALGARTGGGDAAPSAVKLVDRTLQCTTGLQGGARVIFLRAQSAFGQGGELEWLAQATVAGMGQPLPFKPNYRPTLAGVTAGWPPPRPLRAGGIAVDDRACKATRTRVGLSPRGLQGGSVSQLGDEFTCVVAKSFLVRLRAVFRTPVNVERQGRAFTAEGRVARGRIAVATTAGKPLVYAEVAESGGTSRLFTSKGCR
jgi:hypothetical protein